MGSQLHVPARKAADARLPIKHPTATRQPLIPEVLYDLDRTIGCFEAGPLRSFASFAALARETRVVDLLLTARVRRMPSRFEPPSAYATLLFEALVRRLADPARKFPARLGALYLLAVLHEAQPARPRAPIPVLAPQWGGFERLARELRDMRHADGFRALHTLWAGGRLVHRYGPFAVLNATDLQNDEEAEQAAALLPVRATTETLGGCPYALQLEAALPSLAHLEAEYDDARRAAAAEAGETPDALEEECADAHADGALADASASVAAATYPSSSLAAHLERELHSYYRGVWPDSVPHEPPSTYLVQHEPVQLGAEDRALAALPSRLLTPYSTGSVEAARATATEASASTMLSTRDDVLESVGVVAAAHLRREGVRQRPFQPRHKRTKDGGSNRSRKRQKQQSDWEFPQPPDSLWGSPPASTRARGGKPKRKKVDRPL
jgi:hypothetical protein